jgi:hypothetical protein
MSIERQNRAAVSTDSAAANNGDARVRKRARDASRRKEETKRKTEAKLPSFAARSVSGAGNADFFSCFLFPLGFYFLS